MNGVRRRVLATCGLLLAGLAGRGGAGASHIVTIDAFAFLPALLTVRPGDVVRWTNADPVPHTVTATGAFDSQSIAAGAAWTFKAERAGRFDYF
ncbi:MAG TPA: copper-binding protein, partial [Casimicrobiaceae bacterium]|nr:copper-binding protein [Casimicrobiaceae bacterium]